MYPGICENPWAITGESWSLRFLAPEADSMAKNTRPAVYGVSVLLRGGESNPSRLSTLAFTSMDGVEDHQEENCKTKPNPHCTRKCEGPIERPVLGAWSSSSGVGAKANSKYAPGICLLHPVIRRIAWCIPTKTTTNQSVVSVPLVPSWNSIGAKLRRWASMPGAELCPCMIPVADPGRDQLPRPKDTRGLG